MAEWRPLVGGYIIALHQSSVSWSVRKLVAAVEAEQLSKLKVRSGEHLAAILGTAFFGVPPVEIDGTGGVDLKFPGNALRELWRGYDEEAQYSAFEVKSMSGEYRRFEAQLTRAIDRGEEPTVDMTLTIEDAKTVLSRAQTLLDAATEQLIRKTASNATRNIFLIVNPLDALAVEATEDPPIARLLPPLQVHAEIDSVWVLWVPDHLTVFLPKRNEWIDLIFSAMNENEQQLNRGLLSLLQEAEMEYLATTDQRISSPFVFSMTMEDDE